MNVAYADNNLTPNSGVNHVNDPGSYPAPFGGYADSTFAGAGGVGAAYIW